MQKKQIFTLCMVLIAGTLIAQEHMPPKKRVSYEQMTEIMVNDMKLDTKQQKKVAKLNKKYQTLIEDEERKAPDFGRPPMGKRPQGGGMPGGHHSDKSYDFDKKQQKYDKAIAKILSDEQMEGYKKIKPMFASQRRVKEFLLGDDQNLMKDGDFE